MKEERYKNDYDKVLDNFNIGHDYEEKYRKKRFAELGIPFVRNFRKAFGDGNIIHIKFKIIQRKPVKLSRLEGGSCDNF